MRLFLQYAIATSTILSNICILQYWDLGELMIDCGAVIDREGIKTIMNGSSDYKHLRKWAQNKNRPDRFKPKLEKWNRFLDIIGTEQIIHAFCN